MLPLPGIDRRGESYERLSEKKKIRATVPFHKDVSEGEIIRASPKPKQLITDWSKNE